MNAWFGLDTGVQPGVVLTSVIDMFMFLGNSDTSLLLFLKCHICKPVNSDGMF